MSIILAVISGLLTAFSFPTVFGDLQLPNLGFLAWLSLVPLFYVIKDAGPRRSFLYTFLSGYIFYGISLYWLYTALNTYGHLNPFVSVGVLALLIALLASHIALAALFASWVEKKTGINRYWTLPVFWVLCDLLMNYIPCNGFPWGNITNTQYAYLPVIQIVDIVGIYGLTFIMIAANQTIAVLMSSRGAQATTRSSAWDRFALLARNDKTWYAVALVALVLVYGSFRINYIDKEKDSWPSIRTALLQGNVPQDEKWQEGHEGEQIATLKKFTADLKDSNVDLIVWPEASYPVPLNVKVESLDPALLGLTGFKKDPNTYLLMGGISFDRSKRVLYNSAFLLDDNAQILGRYDKAHLVPFGEYVPYKKVLFFAKKLTAPVGNFAEGENSEPLFTDGFQIAPLICYEDLFPEIARAFVKKGANFIVAITNDAWYGRSSASLQHLAISVFRAVENRRFLVKAANTGISAVVDPVGRIISGSGLFEEGMIVSNIKLGTGNSLYTRYGDWFAYGCALVAVFLLIVAGMGKRTRDRLPK